MRKTTPEEVLAWIVIFACLLYGGGPISIISEPSPFTTDLPIAVVVIEDVDARDTVTASQADAMLGVDGPMSIRGYVELDRKGQYVLWNGRQQPTEHSPKWVTDALAKRGDKLPWIVAATPKSGFSKELPKTGEEIISELKRIGGK